MWRVSGITCNAEGFAGETGAVDDLEGGERDTNNLLSCSHYPLKGLAAGRVAGAIPHSDAASQNALDGVSVEGVHDGGRGSGSSEFAEEVETLLWFLGQCCSVVSPGEVLWDVVTLYYFVLNNIKRPNSVYTLRWYCIKMKNLVYSYKQYMQYVKDFLPPLFFYFVARSSVPSLTASACARSRWVTWWHDNKTATTLKFKPWRT